MDGGVPDYVRHIKQDTPTEHVIGAALEDGREVGESRSELQERVADYLRAVGRLPGPARPRIESWAWDEASDDDLLWAISMIAGELRSRLPADPHRRTKGPETGGEA